jgi:hypothetical protein
MKTDLDWNTPTFLHSKMQNFCPPLSRADLQSIPAKRRLEAIGQYVNEHLYKQVWEAAAKGKTSYLFVTPTRRPIAFDPNERYKVTPEDIMEGLKETFPGCTIDFTEEWIDVRPGVREHRAGIKIDWS